MKAIWQLKTSNAAYDMPPCHQISVLLKEERFYAA